LGFHHDLIIGDKMKKILRNIVNALRHDFDFVEKQNLDVVKEYDVNRLDELLDVIKHVKDNNILDDAADYAFDLRDTFYDEGIDDGVSKEVPFMSSAIEILGGYNSPIYINRYRFADAACLEAMEYIIYTNYFINSGKTEKEVFEYCSKGDILICLTLFVEDFKDVKEVPHHYRNTLRKIKRVKWENNDVNMFDDDIISYLSCVFLDESARFFNNFKYGAVYLMACSAVKHNRDVTYEDVVIGYLLVFQLLCEDLTPYVDKYYDEEKVRFRENLR